MFALFKSDARLEYEASRPELRPGWAGVAITAAVVVVSVVATFPLGGLTGGWSFVGSPFAAAVITGVLVQRSRGVRIRLALAAAFLTFAILVILGIALIAILLV